MLDQEPFKVSRNNVVIKLWEVWLLLSFFRNTTSVSLKVIEKKESPVSDDGDLNAVQISRRYLFIYDFLFYATVIITC